jgi:hypothetical protein
LTVPDLTAPDFAAPDRAIADLSVFFAVLFFKISAPDSMLRLTAWAGPAQSMLFTSAILTLKIQLRKHDEFPADAAVRCAQQ